MSDPLRVAAAVEGPTDFIVLSAAIKSLLRDEEFVFHSLQPEFSAAFAAPGGQMGLGWSGVYRWCRQTADQGAGRVSQSPVFAFHDLLIVQVDADVAGKTYKSGWIENETGDLPCEKPCPPASDTTDALRLVILRWMGETEVPDQLVLCTPSKSMEAWVMAALFPTNRFVARSGWECHANPAAQLGQQPIKHRIEKRPQDYAAKSAEFRTTWPRVRRKLTEADRFSVDFLAAVESVSR
ncbi:MAG: hypothetical protein HQ567_32920 [Candidatus Nealsonbacteria bacterium]|nr:hypothetical protein [Candidatus Nealsonbacteria bacterium]